MPLSRSLGFPMLTFYGTGMILGAGIYSVIGKAAGLTEETLWLGFLFAGISVLFTALSYAELSTMFPKAGAEFVYLNQAFPRWKWLGSTIGVSMALSGAATAATVALAFSGYLAQFIDVWEALAAVIVLVVFTGVAIIGIGASGWVTVVSTLIEVGGLLLIIYLGLTSGEFGKSLASVPHLGTLSGSALIVFSFFGFENIVNLAEEAKRPEKDLPRAILLSVVLSTVLYVLVSLAASGILPHEELAQSPAPLMSVAQAVSANAATILGAIALFSTANTALISMIGASRILYSMGQKSALPKALSKVHARRKTPWMASLLILAVALMLVPLGKVDVVASVSSLATLIAFTLVNVALIVLRYRKPGAERAFRVPLSVGKFPVLPAFGVVLSLVLLTQLPALAYLIGGAALTLAAVIFIRRG